ncbi:MAG: metallophosphoesterase [Oscillospiraceae bacterium]|jgi:hypothetical protein|nr:metallophosphoesterase [Oscillospiraceae bacterium]
MSKASRFFRILSIFMALVLVFSVCAAAATRTEPIDKKIQFNSDGKFKILQISDTQDILFPRSVMIQYIESLLDQVQPDLVIFTGDNTEDFSFITGTVRYALNWILEPVNARGIPFTFAFGNHDAFIPQLKDRTFQYYTAYENCLAYDDNPAIFGTGNHNLFIYDKDGKNPAFNLWMIDSNAYDLQSFAYDYVHEDQVQWFKDKAAAIKAEYGNVPSFAFQHITVPEVYELLLPAEDGGTNTKDYNGKKYAQALDPTKAVGHLGEFPCPPVVNTGEFQAFVDDGNVVAFFAGHDHVNNFIGNVNGIDIVQTPGITFANYGEEGVRATRVITLDESDLSTYTTTTLTYEDVLGGMENYEATYSLGSSLFGGVISLLAMIAKLFGYSEFEVLDIITEFFVSL